MYQIIYDFLIGLFPLTPESWQIAFTELVSMFTILWLYIISLKFICYLVKWVGNSLWWR